MKNIPELIVMLTQNDETLPDAARIFEQAKEAPVRCWGFKEKPLPTDEMKRLASRMKECGKTVYLEVVEYTEPECIAGAQTGIDIGCDVLMGTLFFDSVNDLCREHGIRYMPFVGEVTQRPSVLDGTAETMLGQARSYIEKGAYGIDLLGYRYRGNARELIERVVTGLDAPVCVAGSVDSLQRLEELKKIGPQSFTIGGAFFDGSFPGTLVGQIAFITDFMGGAV